MGRDEFDKETYEEWVEYITKQKIEESMPSSTGPLCAPSIFDKDMEQLEKRLIEEANKFKEENNGE